MVRRPVVRVAVAALAALVVILAVVAFVTWNRSRTTDFERAVAAAPAGAERLSWTDWAGVRRELGSDVDETSGPERLSSFLDDAFDADLSSRSALLQSAPRLQESYGWSPASVEWELLSQGTEGAAIVVRISDEADFGDLADRLEGLGYQPPDEADGVWVGGTDLLPRIDPTLTPELAYVALDADDQLLFASDRQAYLEQVVAARSGDGESVDGLDGVAEALGEPLSAAVYSGDYACGALAMANADPGDQEEAAELVAAAGTVDPYLAFAMGALPGGAIRVALEFADNDQAKVNADSRAVLASGPAVGQGGDFGDRFELDSAHADGHLMTLDLDPLEGQYVLSDLSSGPVLFATC